MDEDGIEISRDTVIITINKTTNKCDIPICSECQIGKYKRRSDKTSIENRLISHKLKQDVIKPEKMVSLYQYEIRVKGILLTSKGREKKMISSVVGLCLLIMIHFYLC